MEKDEYYVPNTSQKFNITSDIDLDDLANYGLNVSVDFDTGDVSILRQNREILTVKKNPETNKIEVKRMVKGVMQPVYEKDKLLSELEKQIENLNQNPIPFPEIDKFFYHFICNDGFNQNPKVLDQCETSTKKLFWQFFNYYIQIRFKGSYHTDLMQPEFIEIEAEIIEMDIEDEKDNETREELKNAQFFSYTRIKNRKKDSK